MAWKDFPNLFREGQVDYFAAEDGARLRYAAWPTQADSRGIIILANGHREYMEKYYEFISDFLERGFALYTMDNRGQGLSDRILPDRCKSHTEGFEQFGQDLNDFVTKVVMADPRAGEIPLYLVGHSMGGHICLRYLHDFPHKMNKSIILAPMIEFKLGPPIVKYLLKFLIRLASRIGFRKSFAFGQTIPFSREHRLIRQKLLTHDEVRYNIETEIIESMPDVYVGGATFGWLDRALKSIKRLHRPGYIKEISLPVMVALAGDDHIVDTLASERLFSNYDNFHIVTIDGSRHEIYRESDHYRDQLWQEMDRFLGC